MTDKVQKIRAEIERRISRNKRNKVFEDVPEKRHQLIIEGQLLGELKHFIDSMQEEPATSVWHDTRSEEPIVGRNIVMLYYNHIYSGEYLGERFFGREKFTLMSDSKWAYFDDLIKL